MSITGEGNGLLEGVTYFKDHCSQNFCCLDASGAAVSLKEGVWCEDSESREVYLSVEGLPE